MFVLKLICGIGEEYGFILEVFIIFICMINKIIIFVYTFIWFIFN